MSNMFVVEASEDTHKAFGSRADARAYAEDRVAKGDVDAVEIYEISLSPDVPAERMARAAIEARKMRKGQLVDVRRPSEEPGDRDAASTGRRGITLLTRAVAALYGKTLAQARARLDRMTEEERREYAGHPVVVAKIAELRAEAAKAKRERLTY